MIDRTIQILIIDDDPELLAVLECGLQQVEHYRVTAETNAQRGAAAIRAGGWDLLIADYSLNDPELDGIGLLRLAHRQPAPPLVIMITAFASMQVTLESITLGAHNFLTKPFQLDELFLVVRNAADTIVLSRENRLLHERLAAMHETVEQLRQDQDALMSRLRRIEYDGTGGGEPEGTEGEASLTQPQIIELRRRRMRDQVSAYLRTGERIAERLQMQHAHLEELKPPPPRT